MALTKVTTGVLADNIDIGGTLTNASAAVKVAGKETIYIPAAAMYPQTTNGCSDLEQVELSANNPELKVLDFDPSTPEYAQFTIAFPKSWNEGNLTAQAFFTVSGTNTGSVVWQLNVKSMPDDAAITGFGSSYFLAPTAHSGTANEIQITAESSAITVSGAAADTMTFFRLCRDASGSNDTQTGDARLLGIKLFFTTDAKNDA